MSALLDLAVGELLILFEPAGGCTFLCRDCWEELGGLQAEQLPDDRTAGRALAEAIEWRRGGGGCQWCGLRFEPTQPKAGDA